MTSLGPVKEVSRLSEWHFNQVTSARQRHIEFVHIHDILYMYYRYIYILYIEIGDHGVKRDGRDTFFRGNGIPGVLELMKRGTSLMIRPVVIC